MLTMIFNMMIIFHMMIFDMMIFDMMMKNVDDDFINMFYDFHVDDFTSRYFYTS
jgi:hypothetical protein